MLLFDLTHTSHTQARTGIQQVCRTMFAAYQKTHDTLGLTYDRYSKHWRPLQPWEVANLGDAKPGGKRGAHWPFTARIRGRVARAIGSTEGAQKIPAAAKGLVVPEVFSGDTAAAFPNLFRKVAGSKIAIFHDAIALKLPELSPAKTTARFSAYLQELQIFDGIAAVSNDSRQSLMDYWTWLGLKAHPPVMAIPLPLLKPVIAAKSDDRSTKPTTPIVLSVGSLEGRKNHLALLEACESLWARGLQFELRLIGFTQPETGAQALERVRLLQSQGRALRYDGAVDDATLEQAYAEAAFTVYPSMMEGFGLPVLESLAHGKPCICSGRGALGESAKGGGCIALDQVGAADLADAVASLLKNPAMLALLATDARRRTLRTWLDYQRDMSRFFGEIAGARQ